MASTNTNTDNTATLSTDVFEVAEFLDQIRANNIPDLDETSSIVGIFGYMNEMFTTTLQNTLIAISETTNETIPTRAKYTKNVIAHAMNLGITDINATPAVMTLMIYLPVEQIEENFTELNSISGRAKFVLCHDVPFYVGDYEFHLDYDVILTRIKNPQGNYVYTAMYDLFETGTTTVKQDNPVSDITNPYITTIIQTTMDDIDYVAFSARLHQVSIDIVTKNVLTSNSIENKVVTFDFDDQLAAFDVDIIENDETTHLVPIYSGLVDNSAEDGTWCYYEYVGENTIRVLFDSDSYVPGLNAEVNINVQLTEGANGNFTYTSAFRTSLRSDTYNDYSGMWAYVYPLLNGLSSGGKDKKSVDTLKKIIPREASSRGAVINTTDLQNFFNSIDDDETHLHFKKKRDNPFERLYYAYLVMKKNGNVYPTNTLPLTILQTDFKGFSGSNNLVISPGTVFYYYDHGVTGADNAFATVIPPTYEEGLDEDEYPYPMTLNEDGELMRVFEYMSPYLISIDDDLISSYFMTIMNDNKTFSFDSINTDSDLQFVSTNMNWTRAYEYEDEDGNTQLYSYKYVMTVDMVQNNSANYNLVTILKDANGQEYYDDIRVKMILILYADETDDNPYRYIEGTLISYDDNAYTYTFQFELTTDDLMDLNNRINILGINNCKPEEYQTTAQVESSHGYMNANTYARLFILADFSTYAGDTVGDVEITADTAETILYGEDGIGNRTELESILPIRDDIVDEFLDNNIYLDKNGEQVNVVTIMKANSDYLDVVKAYNNNELETETAILRYLRNNKNSDFVQNTLLQDEDVIEVIEAYSYVDFSTYTVCNVMSIDGGIDFYHDYSDMMTSTVIVEQIQSTDSDGNLLTQKITHTDSLGNEYYEYKPIYEVNDDGTYIYNYKVKRIPMVRNGFLYTEDLMQDFVAELEERRLYIEECLYALEDTFGIDLKFFNTYGPSQLFYYNIPSSQNYKVRVALKQLNVYTSTADEDDEDAVAGTLTFGTQVTVTKVKGQWGYILSPYEGWIKLSSCTKVINYIDNVALTMEFQLEAETSADKYIPDNIIQDVKDYIEDINEINELHIPNIITLITNNYREQLVYFEFLDVNGYGAACQHLYLDESVDADITPEFLNVATKIDGSNDPEISITVY